MKTAAPKRKSFPEHEKLSKERMHIMDLLRFRNFLRGRPERPIQEDIWEVYAFLEIDRVKLAEERLEALRREKP
jgi:hypothetical protein